MDEIVARYVEGEPVEALAAAAGCSAGAIRKRAAACGRSGQRRQQRRNRCLRRTLELRDAVLWLDDVDVLLLTRSPTVARPRMVVMSVLRNEGHSLPDIAEALGLLDHTTVLHGCRRVQSDRDLQAMVVRLTQFASRGKRIEVSK